MLHGTVAIKNIFSSVALLRRLWIAAAVLKKKKKKTHTSKMEKEEELEMSTSNEVVDSRVVEELFQRIEREIGYHHDDTEDDY